MPNEFSAFLSLVSYPVYVLGGGRGALFVPEMDEEVFPPRTPPRCRYVPPGARCGR